jgi:TolB-like protein/Tfp pilus assembly protein PilF
MAIVVGLLVLVAVGILGLNVGGARDRLSGRGQAPRIQSIAVLPLANLSGDPSQEYFADGLTDELITMLARHSSLRVVSRTSALQYKGAKRPLREIGRELGVDGILEGSVERSGNRVHMTVQLVDAATDTHLWAQSYDRSFNDALSLPSELSETIAREVKLAATPGGPQRPVSPEAHDAYLHGRHSWLDDNYDRSQEYFEKAIELQPDYAAAWSGLADTYTVRAVGLAVPPREVMPKAKAAARKAVELDDSVGEAHNALAAVYLFGDWDLESADRESRRAIELSPNYSEPRHLRCYVLTAMNRLDEALQEQRRSSEMDPFARPWALGAALVRARQLDAAIGELRRRVDAQPQDGDARFFLEQAYWGKGMWKEYVAERETELRALGLAGLADAERHAFESGGREGVAEWQLKRVQGHAREGYVSPWDVAFAWARVGKKEETLRFLEEAYREHSASMVFLQHEPMFDFLHSDERYRALVKKTGFPPAY